MAKLATATTVTAAISTSTTTTTVPVTVTSTVTAIKTAGPDKSLSDIGRQPVWKVREAALLLRCDVRTIRRELNRGTITGVHIGHEWRIPANQFSSLARAARSSENDQVQVKASGAERFLKNTHDRSSLTQPAAGTSATIDNATATAVNTISTTISTQHTLRIHLLGSPQIYVDDVRIAELERSNRRSQVIQMLALHRAGLSVMRLASSLNIAAHQYEDEDLDPRYVRTLVWGARDQVRKCTGWSDIIQSPTKCGVGLHHYRLPDNTMCDLWEFEDKLDEADRLMARAAVVPAGEAGDKVGGEARDGANDGNGSNGSNGSNSATERAAVLREEALQLYKGEFCEGSNNGCIAQAARMLEERYIRSALQQGDYWRAKALHAAAPKSQGQMQDMSSAYGSMLYSAGVSNKPTQPMQPTSLRLTLPEVQTFWREALRNYERVLKVDIYHEEAYIHSMECNAHLGNARGVDQIFTRCQDVLHADLMQPPGVDVVRTYQQCKALLSVGNLIDQAFQQPRQYAGQSSVEFK